MYTKADFQAAVRNTLRDYPTVQALYEAGDPRIHQQLDAMATMLAMLSSQIETAQTEQFEKSRSATILADAAMRGIVRKGRAARAKIKAVNSGKNSFVVETGRNLIDSSGRLWRIETAATVPAGESATFEATQREVRTITHTVDGSVPFYAIEIPQTDEEAYICQISVRDVHHEYEYRDQYINSEAGERIFHVEADDRQRVYVRFGYEDVVGVQPEDGEELTLTISYTNGKISVDYGSPFSFEYTQSVDESNIELTMDSLLEAGEDPISMTVLRDIAKYPSVYREDAVFLGEFGFLVRRNFPSLQFLSVWNECIEEQARGASVDNINALFVACLSADGTEKTLEETDPKSPKAPTEIEEDDLTDTQKEIERVILRADDSYRVRFFTPVISKIKITINATVSTSYIVSDVKSKIEEAILEEYGKESAASRRGQQQPLYRQVYELLKNKVAALTDGNADLTVSIDNGEGVGVRPELWRFVDESSLTVTVQTTNIIQHTWGG